MYFLRRFIWDEAGTESAEYTVLALIVFVLIVVMMIPVSGRLGWLWRGLLEILTGILETAPEAERATPAP
jgi:Flp pilus assembly pilin Flp